VGFVDLWQSFPTNSINEKEYSLTFINFRLAILSLLCNHPECFNAKLHDRKKDARKEIAAGSNTPSSRDVTDLDDIAAELNAAVWKVGVSQELIDEETKLFKEEAPDMKSVDLSYKVKILCQILDTSKAAQDKVLVFSQSIPTLDYLEDLCIRQQRKYARLDGSTPMPKRQDMIKNFNKGKTDIYLISTAAGGLGLNLPSANRVIIFDFKWNPIMEEQAVGRAYRIGQTKPTFVYRFVAGGTFEDTVHNKTVFKMQLASRVVDKKNPIAYASKKLGDYLFEPKDVLQKDLTEFVGMDPQVLDKILESQKDSPIIRAIVQSDTFEKDDDDKLTAEELKEVKQLLNDEQLKRSDPKKWLQIQSERSKQQMYNVPHRQGLAVQAQHPPQTNTGSAVRPVSAGQGMHPTLPARPVDGQQKTPLLPQNPQYGLSASAPTSSVNSSVPAGAMPVNTPAQNPEQAPSPNRGRHNTAVAGNPPRRSGSPIAGANTKIVRTPSPENRKTAPVQKTSLSTQVVKTPPSNVSRKEGPASPENQRKV
jgi:superfamily II DNA/RNA helicase